MVFELGRNKPSDQIGITITAQEEHSVFSIIMITLAMLNTT